VNRKGDLDTETDAGTTADTALTIAPGIYQRNFGGLEDQEDRFKLTAKKGEKYVFTMLPQKKEGPKIFFDLIDSLKIDVSHEKRGGGSGQGLQVKFTVPDDGDYYLIAKYSGVKKYSDYEIKLTKEE